LADTTQTFDKNANGYTVFFATSVCVVLAVCLAAAFNGLGDRIRKNEAFDKQVNVLIATGLHSRTESRSRPELEEMFDKYIRGEVLEVKRGTEMRTVKEAGKTFEKEFDVVKDVVRTEHELSELPALLREQRREPDPSKRREFVPFYRRVDDAGNDVAYCIPISGYGLWSTLYGYLALKKDLDHVQGITFYKHGETPGLGGEVENLAWQKQWVDKEIRGEDGNLVSVTVKKGMVDPQVPYERDHMVDGLSGATITSNGVTRFVENDLETYEPYFQKILRQGE
jgi:Na+-transporting NADH:ubiquinone oxidoreductase subunit C